jgi:hypothetical protein
MPSRIRTPQIRWARTRTSGTKARTVLLARTCDRSSRHGPRELYTAGTAPSFSMCGAAERSFHLEGSPVGTGYLLMQVGDVEPGLNEVEINGKDLPSLDIMPSADSGVYTTWMDRIPEDFLQQGTNRIVIRRTGNDSQEASRGRSGPVSPGRPSWCCRGTRRRAPCEEARSLVMWLSRRLALRRHRAMCRCAALARPVASPLRCGRGARVFVCAATCWSSSVTLT